MIWPNYYYVPIKMGQRRRSRCVRQTRGDILQCMWIHINMYIHVCIILHDFSFTIRSTDLATLQTIVVYINIYQVYVIIPCVNIVYLKSNLNGKRIPTLISRVRRIDGVMFFPCNFSASHRGARVRYICDNNI